MSQWTIAIIVQDNENFSSLNSIHSKPNYQLKIFIFDLQIFYLTHNSLWQLTQPPANWAELVSDMLFHQLI